MHGRRTRWTALGTPSSGRSFRACHAGPCRETPRSSSTSASAGARRKPELITGLTPGSCGDICGKVPGQKGSKCKHTCTEPCHPGPCPPCTLLRSAKCHCGKSKVDRKCGEAVSAEGISCGAVCGNKLAGCQHTCSKTCHAGPCDACDVPVEVACGCGKKTTTLPCAVAQKGFVFEAVCGWKLVCGIHLCTRPCHGGDCGPCPKSPSGVSVCPCGRRGLSDMDTPVRTSCEDPIPSCGGPCRKPMGCISQQQCTGICSHSGACKSCSKTVSAECRCGASIKSVDCGLEKSELHAALTCEKTSNSLLSCRKHRCRVKCWPHRRRKFVHGRGSGVVASAHLWADSVGSAEAHQCQQECGKMLNCGLHTCDLPCGHRGACPSCGLLLREPVTCGCGAAATPVPVRCGTPAPPCSRPCTRPRPCGHPCPMPSCQEGECPKCVELVLADCVGQHGAPHYVACHLATAGIKCHRSCGRTLKCGIHGCRKQCHSVEDEDCEESSAEGCNQICGLPRACGHGCGAKCHPDRRCPDVPCREPITVTCPCGTRKEEAPCLRGGPSSSSGPSGSIRLACTDECRYQGRLLGFAKAVGKVKTTTDTPTSYSGFLLRFAEEEITVLQLPSSKPQVI